MQGQYALFLLLIILLNILFFQVILRRRNPAHAWFSILILQIGNAQDTISKVKKRYSYLQKLYRLPIFCRSTLSLQYSGKNLSPKPTKIQALVINMFYFPATQVY